MAKIWYQYNAFKPPMAMAAVRSKAVVLLLFVIMAYEPVYEISNDVVFVTSKASDQPAHTRRLIRAFASRLSIL